MQEPIDKEVAGYTRVRVVKRRRSIWEDRLVRSMAFWAAALLIVLMSTVISALQIGAIGPNRAPQTALQRELMAWESVTTRLDTAATADQWQSFVLALISDSQLNRAQTVISEVNARQKIDQSRGANMLYCTAVLQSAKGSEEEALATFKKVMELTMAAYQKEIARKDESSRNWAKAVGIHDNYYYSALDRARILRTQGEWRQGVEMLDIYLEAHPQAAGVLVDRAYLKARLGDAAGAETDYRAALRYVPDFPEALEGLQTIGAAE